MGKNRKRYVPCTRYQHAHARCDVGGYMGSINTRNNRLTIDFRYLGQRCREQTKLDDTPANRKRLKQILDRIEAEITLGTFNYEQYFPTSRKVIELREQTLAIAERKAGVPLVESFAEKWLLEKEIEWRESHKRTQRCIVNVHLIPRFGRTPINELTPSMILEFRSDLAKLPGKNGKISNTRINKILMVLRMILTEAATRFSFSLQWPQMKQLRVARSDIEPFTLEEVLLILEKVRTDFKNYYTVRFFSGMRTGEIDGLVWRNIDFERRQIQVHQALVLGKIVPTKTDGSYRSIAMSQMVYEALKKQEETSKKHSVYVFCNNTGGPVDNKNISARVWYPLLRHLNLEKRRPYQTRHTAATLWLAAGESPEWIANQMGHSTTEMLFRVYSRYVPNLTRQDGSAFERLLEEQSKVPKTYTQE